MTETLRASPLLAVLLGTVLAGGCGGTGLPPSDLVSLEVVPAQATVPVGGTVTLTGSANGFTTNPLASWWVQESKDLDFNNACGKLDTEAKDFTGCPYGFIMFHDVNTVPSKATYFAPMTPGRYHVTLSMSQWTRFDHLEKEIVATITVTP
jgi:hypothetical protein